MAAKIVFLFDVDNTLLDNDAVIADLRQFLADTLGADRHERYWKIFETLRDELGYADYLGALQRYRVERPRDIQILAVSHFLLDYPFPTRLFAGALQAVAHVAQFGTPAILSDGDVVFQPRKIERAGLLTAVQKHVMIYVHKENELDDVAARYPADHYVLIDDKLRILSAVKKIWGPRVTTVFPRQGHYAHDPAVLAANPSADITIEGIGELTHFDQAALVGAAGK